MPLLDWLSDSRGYMPHGHCYLWQPEVLWLNVGSDALIAASYYTIPFVLYAFVRRRRHELPYWWLPLLFSAFIFLCGTTHLISIWTTWNPDYRIDGLVKLATGLVSATTALTLLFVMPKVMRLQTPAALEREVAERTADLATANERLHGEVAVREETAERLRQRVEELETLVRLAPVGIVVARDRECRTIVGNSAVTAMLAAEQGRNVSATAPTDQRVPYRLEKAGVEVAPEDMPMQRAARTGQTTLGEEYRFVFPEGRAVDVILNAAPLVDAGGTPRGAIGTLQDITRQKAVEAELRDADRRKDEFLATLAHELRNPLAPMRNAVEVLRHEGLAPGQRASAREMIARQLQQLVRLVDDLLDVSRIATGKIRLRRTRIDLRRVLEQAVETAGPLLAERDHALELRLPDGPVELHADPVRLAQVFVNLLNNAARYTDPGGRITLAAANDGTRAQVEVRDTGIGLAPDSLERIFDLFSQVDAAAPNSRGGLGIGLALTRRLVEMHDGTVRAESAGPGRGSTFSVELPLAKTDAAAAAAPESAAPGHRRWRIVVADDNRDAADSLALLLSTAGHEVHRAYDGVAAAAAIERLRPDVALLDIGMPGLDGYAVAARVRAAGHRDLRLAALTGWGQASDRQAATAAGFDRHFTKPVEPDALARWLEAGRTDDTEH